MTDNLGLEVTAQVAEANNQTGAAEVNLGKFKDVDALLSAYTSLEAEFTRRSQRLRQAEGMLGKLNSGGGQGTENSAEVLPPAANNQGEDGEIETSALGDNTTPVGGYEKEAEEFLIKYPEASKFSKELSQIAVRKNDFSEGFLHRAYVELLKDKLSDGQRLMADQGHLKRLISEDSALRDSIIREYLSGIKDRAGVRLMSDTGKAVTAPPLRPKSIEEAGAMAKEIINKNLRG